MVLLLRMKRLLLAGNVRIAVRLVGVGVLGILLPNLPGNVRIVGVLYLECWGGGSVVRYVLKLPLGFLVLGPNWICVEKLLIGRIVEFLNLLVWLPLATMLEGLGA